MLNFLDLGAFLEEQFCENCRACNAKLLRKIISFLNDVYLQLIFNSKTVLENIIQYVLKILEERVWDTQYFLSN